MQRGGLDTIPLTGWHPTPRSTTDRVVMAWLHAHHVTRRALVAAVVTSIAIGAAAPVPFVARVAIGAVGTLLALATLVDVHERRLPNRLLGAALAVASIGWFATLDPISIVRAVVGLLVAGSLLMIVRIARGIGMGDVKMAAVVGASTGGASLLAPPAAIAVAATVGATYGLLSHRLRIAFGPALWLGWASAFALASGGVVS